MGGVATGPGESWVSFASDPLSSIANWTVVNGVWAINAGVLRHTGAIANYSGIYYNLARADAFGWQCQVDVNFTAGSNFGGVACRWSESLGGGVIAGSSVFLGGLVLGVGSRIARSDAANVDKAFGFNAGEWHTVRLVVIGSLALLYVDNVLDHSASLQVPNDVATFRVGLSASDGTVDFRNFKAWILTAPNALT